MTGIKINLSMHVSIEHWPLHQNALHSSIFTRRKLFAQKSFIVENKDRCYNESQLALKLFKSLHIYTNATHLQKLFASKSYETRKRCGVIRRVNTRKRSASREIMKLLSADIAHWPTTIGTPPSNARKPLHKLLGAHTCLHEKSKYVKEKSPRQ